VHFKVKIYLVVLSFNSLVDTRPFSVATEWVWGRFNHSPFPKGRPQRLVKCLGVQLDRPKTNQSNRHCVKPASTFVIGVSICKSQTDLLTNLKFAGNSSGFSQGRLANLMN